MARTGRNDEPGAWHHVVNRGIARRTIFDHAQDMRMFTEQLEEAVVRGDIEVHAYCLMNNHFHLLVRSPKGDLGSAMQRVQTEYSRWFNRSRKRDGSLVRGRYRSKRIDSTMYQRAVVSYIDRNPISAGIVARAADYRFGSAREYLGSGAVQATWLNRSWIERTVVEALELSSYTPRGYEQVFGRFPASLARVIESRHNSRATSDDLDDLVAASPESVRQWMKRKASLADGVAPGLPVVDLEDLETVIKLASDNDCSQWSIGKRDAWEILRAGLARDLCGEPIRVIADKIGCGPSKVSRMVQLHRQLVREDESYGERAGRVAVRAFGVWRR